MRWERQTSRKQKKKIFCVGTKAKMAARFCAMSARGQRNGGSFWVLRGIWEGSVDISGTGPSLGPRTAPIEDFSHSKLVRATNFIENFSVQSRVCGKLWFWRPESCFSADPLDRGQPPPQNSAKSEISALQIGPGSGQHGHNRDCHRKMGNSRPVFLFHGLGVKKFWISKDLEEFLCQFGRDSDS